MQHAVSAGDDRALLAAWALAEELECQGNVRGALTLLEGLLAGDGISLEAEAWTRLHVAHLLLSHTSNAAAAKKHAAVVVSRLASCRSRSVPRTPNPPFLLTASPRAWRRSS